MVQGNKNVVVNLLISESKSSFAEGLGHELQCIPPSINVVDVDTMLGSQGR
jgi:hypothetical protein